MCDLYIMPQIKEKLNSKYLKKSNYLESIHNSDSHLNTLKDKETNPEKIVSNHGHRKRLKEKFLKSGFTGFHDYEIIELVLFQAIPRQDVKLLAKSLLNHFGNIEAIFKASDKELKTIKGCGDTVCYTLKLFSETGLVIAREQLNQAPLLAQWSELSNYLRLKLAHLTHEEFHVLFLNAKCYLIDDMKVFRGTVNKSAIYPREIIKHALEVGATSLVLAHNHPSGLTNPSHDDIDITHHISQAAEIMDIKLVDHIIIGRHEITSFRQLNLLEYVL